MHTRSAHLRCLLSGRQIKEPLHLCKTDRNTIPFPPHSYFFQSPNSTAAGGTKGKGGQRWTYGLGLEMFILSKGSSLLFATLSRNEWMPCSLGAPCGRKKRNRFAKGLVMWGWSNDSKRMLLCWWFGRLQYCTVLAAIARDFCALYTATAHRRLTH